MSRGRRAGLELHQGGGASVEPRAWAQCAGLSTRFPSLRGKDPPRAVLGIDETEHFPAGPGHTNCKETVVVIVGAVHNPGVCRLGREGS